MKTAEIKEKILAAESFWVASESERVAASRLASALDKPYHTRKADRGGFYVVRLSIPTRKPKR